MRPALEGTTGIGGKRSNDSCTFGPVLDQAIAAKELGSENSHPPNFRLFKGNIEYDVFTFSSLNFLFCLVHDQFHAVSRVLRYLN